MTLLPEVPELPQDARRAYVEVLAPFGDDARVITHVIEMAGAHALVCASVTAICDQFNDHTGAMVLVEEALENQVSVLTERLHNQPAWSDIPIILLSNSRGQMGTGERWSLFRQLGNATVLERPLHPESLMIAVRAALRGRAWQHIVRDQMTGLQASARELEERVNDRTRSLYAAIAERKQLEQALAEARKLESLGRVTGGVAHDFNNILQVITLSSTILAQMPASETARRERAVQAIQRAADRGAKLTHQLLAFARRQPLQPRHFDLKRKLIGMADYLQHAIEDKIQLSLELPDDLWKIRADPTQLEAAILNLAINAKEAMPDGGILVLRAENVRLPSPDFPKAGHLAGDFVIVSVTDSGAGMPPDVADQAFEPFFTTRHASGQTGLGLSQVYGFATQSGGAVWISPPPTGTCVALALPRSEQGADATHAAALDAAARMSFPGLRVLCVEDNDQLADVTVSVLGQLGCIVERAECAERALAHDLHKVDLVFSDISMPGRIDGLDMARLIATRRPELPVVLTSGYMVAPERLEHAGALFLPKPYTVQELRTTLTSALYRTTPLQQE